MLTSPTLAVALVTWEATWDRSTASLVTPK